MSTATPQARKASWRSILAVVIAIVLLGALVTRQYWIAALILLALLAAGFLFARARWADYQAGGKMAARRRRKYQGWAGGRDVARAVRSAAALTRRLAPGTSLLILGTRRRLCRRQRVAVCRENSALYVGPPGSGKSAALACHAADAPGALLATSTKTELLLDTLPYRAGKGRVWILNPDGYGGIPTTLAWSPLEGCISGQVAIRRAGDFTQSAPANEGSSGDGQHWASKGAGLLAVAFHAAAVSGGSMEDAWEWVGNPHDPALRAAYTLPAADWKLARDLMSLLAAPPEYVNSVVTTAEAALSWMRDDVMAAAACPEPGEGFSAWEFARSSDSVYLIGEERPHGSLAPYFSALAAEIFEQLKGHAMETTAGRLRVPATFVLDEMPLTCPLPAHRMLAHARGYLITMAMGIQSLSQLRSKWGEQDGDTIRSACPVEVFLGGEKRHADLEAVSAVAGRRDTWTGPATARTPGSEPLMPPEALHRLGKGRAVILMPGCKPVLASLPAIWKRKGHQRAALGNATATLGRQPAIGAPRGQSRLAATPRRAVLSQPVPAITAEQETPSWPHSPALTAR